MTHNTLTNKLIDFKEMSDIGKQQKALRLVVKLHKPTNDDLADWCFICDESWPCLTIKTIQKELK